MDPTAKTLIICGAVLILLGGAWQLGWLQLLRLGRLPGDIFIEKENIKIYFPITTGILISLVWGLATWIWRQM